MNSRDHLFTQSGRQETYDVRQIFDDVVGDEVDEARQKEWNVAFSIADLVNRIGGGVIDIWLPGVGTEASKLVGMGLTVGQQEQMKQAQIQQGGSAALLVAVPGEQSKYSGVAALPLPKDLSSSQVKALRRAEERLREARARKTQMTGEEKPMGYERYEVLDEFEFVDEDDGMPIVDDYDAVLVDGELIVGDEAEDTEDIDDTHVDGTHVLVEETAPFPRGRELVHEETLLGTHLCGVDVLGALPRREVGTKPAGGLATALSRAAGALERAKKAITTTLAVSRIKVKGPRTKVQGSGMEVALAGAQWDVILGAVGADAVIRTVDVIGAGAVPRRPSAAAIALATKAAASSAALAVTRREAAGAGEKVRKANVAIDRHIKSIRRHQDAGVAAEKRVSAAKDVISQANTKIEEIKRKIGTRVKGNIIVGDKASDQVVYDSRLGKGRGMPEDAVVFPATAGWPRYSKGSWSFFYGPGKAPLWRGTEKGYVWGWDKMNWPSSTTTRWISRFGSGMGGPNWHDDIQDDVAVADASHAGLWEGRSSGEVFGPLIGNPMEPDYKDLHFDPGINKWFWLRKDAPKKMTEALEAYIKAVEDEIKRLEKETEELGLKKREKEDADRKADEDKTEADHQATLAQIAREAEIQEKRLAIEDANNQAALKRQQEKDEADYQAELRKSEIEEKKVEREREKIEREREREERMAPSFEKREREERTVPSFEEREAPSFEEEEEGEGTEEE